MHKNPDPHVPTEARARLLSSYVAGQRVLEVGCGAGEMLAGVAHHASQVVGVDVSGSASADPLAPIVRGSPLHLPFSSHVFDMVYAFDLVSEQERTEDLLRELARVVRPGGLILAGIQNRLSPALWIERLLGRRRDRETRQDLLVEVKNQIPHELELQEVHGIGVVPQRPVVNGMSVLAGAMGRFEALVEGTRLRFLSSSLVLALRKRDDLEYKER